MGHHQAPEALLLGHRDGLHDDLAQVHARVLGFSGSRVLGFSGGGAYSALYPRCQALSGVEDNRTAKQWILASTSFLLIFLRYDCRNIS
jgi:hypothetical protein